MQTATFTKSMIAGEGPGIIEMNRLLTVLSRRQVARGCLSLLVAALVMIALPQPALGQTQSGLQYWTGKLKVTKVVTGSLTPQPTGRFSIDVVCGSQGHNLRLANGDSTTISAGGDGTTCTITEPTLPPPFTANGLNCTWYRVSPPTQTVTVNSNLRPPVQPVTVTNSYNCQAPTGTLHVKKLVTGTESPQPVSLFTIEAHCGNQYFWKQVYNPNEVVFPLIPLGTTCAVYEPLTPQGTFMMYGKTCTWNPPPPTQTVPINSANVTVIVYNSYTCTNK